MPPLLEIQGLRKLYSVRNPGFCASIESLTLFAGQALGITGASGCGKSTLLEMLALLTRPTMVSQFLLRANWQAYDLAKMWLYDAEYLSHIRRNHMGFVHQAGGLYPFLNVWENIAFPLRLQGVSAPEIAERVEELLDFLGLHCVAQSLPERLSYGERQRTAVARALAHRPSLLLADEPTSALDPDSGRDVMRLLLRGTQQSGSALLVVSHDHALLESAGIPAASMHLCADAAQHTIYYTLDLSEQELLSNTNKEESVSQQCGACTTENSRSLHATSCCASQSPSASKRRSNRYLPFFLAWRDFIYERMLSLCAILAFAAAMTPLMLLWGLRTGVITTLSQRLLNNPAALAINPYSSQRYTDKDIAELAALPSVDFIVPLTRTLSSTVHIVREGHSPITADVLPTAPGDPLLQRYATVPSEGYAVITQELARSFPDITQGEELTLQITRRHEGQLQHVICSVRIHAIIPDAADWKNHIYLPLPLLIDMERYRDGFAVPARAWPGYEDQPPQCSYAGFRMYVQSLDAVIPMRDALKKRGIDSYTFAREVEAIQHLQKALTVITLLVGGVTLTGMAFSLASLAVANVRRKARFFAQSSLMGLYRGEILSLPLVQMTFIAVLAASCSLALYTCTAALLDVAAAPWLKEGERACSLSIMQIIFLYTGALILSCLCGTVACRHLLQLQPAEVLRRDT